MYRYDIINTFVKNRFTKNCDYLEIGVLDPSGCFDKIEATHKTSVDPGIEFKENPVHFNVTSDHFFELLNSGKTKFSKNHTWDIVFIDGLHIADQCFKDINNALKHTKDDAVIVLHDCNPPEWFYAHSVPEFFYKNGGGWNGSVWKSFYYTRTLTDYLTYTVDTDCGIGIIDKKYKSTPIKHDNIFFDYGTLASNRKHYLGLRSIEEFLETFNIR